MHISTCHLSQLFPCKHHESYNNINSVVGSTHSFLKVTNWFRFYKKSSVTHSSLSYLVFQSIVLLAKTWPGHLEIGSRNNNSRCLASQHLQNSSYLFFSRVVCILDCFPCTLIELNYQKKVKKPNLVSFLEMDSIRKMKYCYLMSLFMWTCENLKSLFFHIFST